MLVLIAHFGNYDLMGLFASRLLGYPVTIITKTLKNQRLNELWWELRQKAGLKTLPSHNAYRACVRALRRNELVGFMLDQNRPSGQGVFVDFFGKPASTTPGLAMMSAQTGAPDGPLELAGPLAESAFYVIEADWLRLIDNTLGFGHREEQVY